MKDLGQKEKSDSKLVSWLLLLVLAFIWGSSFILMKRALFTSDGSQLFSPEQVASLRIALASLALLPLAIKHLRSLIDKRVRFLLFSGLIGNTIPAFLFTYAQTNISSALAGMLNATTPLFTFILGVSAFGVLFKKKDLFGVGIALIGAIGLIYFRSDGSVSLNKYALYLLLATLCYGASINVIKKFLGELHPLAISSLSLFLVGPWVAIFAWHLGAFEVIFEHPHGKEGFVYVLILAVIGTALALILFNYLIQKESALFASTVTYLMPVVAIVWGVLDNESVSLMQLVCIVTILIGVWSLNKRS